jgi:hypothetical protein
MREYGHQAVVWQTASPAVALELLATGAWSGAGVLGPEAFPRSRSWTCWPTAPPTVSSSWRRSASDRLLDT